MSKSRVQTRPTSARTPPVPAVTRRLVFQIESPERRALQSILQPAQIVGRASQEDTAQPDIDLTPASAKEAGVSRLHARLSYHDDTLFIEDLNSTNGSRINGVDLVPGKTYRLTPTDEIELGSMRLSVRVVVV